MPFGRGKNNLANVDMTDGVNDMNTATNNLQGLHDGLEVMSDVAMFGITIPGGVEYALVKGGMLGLRLIKVSKTIKGGVQLSRNAGVVMGQSYKSVGEVTSQINNTGLLSALNKSSKGDWVKVYEAGIKNGNKVEIHYFRNNTTRKVFDVKTKYNKWHQKAIKKLTE